MRMLLSLIFCFALVTQAASRNAYAQPAEETASLPDVCHFIASVGRGLYGDYLRDFTQRQGWVDANNDGTPEYATLVANGSAHVTGITLLQDGYPLPELSMRHEADKEEFFLRGWGLRDQQWLNYRGTVYLLGMLGGSDRLVQHAWVFTPDYSGEKVCGFDIHKRVLSAYPTAQAVEHFKADTRLTEKALHGLCRKVAQQKADGYVQPQPADIGNLGNSTRSSSFVMADIDNDGQEEKLLRVSYASGAGPGCNGAFLLHEGDATLLPRRAVEGNQPLYTAQHVDFTGPHPNCDRTANPRLLVYEGHTFLERGDLSAPLRDTSELYHELWYVTGNDAIPVCRFDIVPDARQMFP